MRNFVVELARTRWLERGEVAHELARSEAFAPRAQPNRSCKTVALYYHTLSGGGAQRVTVDVAALLSDSYSVILVSDEDEQAEPPERLGAITCTYVPSVAKNTGEGFDARFDAWQRIVADYEIDCVISGEWVRETTLWDLLALRCCDRKPAFIIHSHNFNAVPFGFAGDGGYATQGLYALCDGVVALSECDRRYASCFNAYVARIDNPITVVPASEPLTGQAPDMVWAGRFSREKQPADALYAMAHIMAIRPDIRLFMLGDGPLRAELEALADSLDIADNVDFCGFVDDVAAYLQHASAAWCTSLYEGSPLYVAEVLASGLPLVSYDMPWLTFFEDGRGIVTVPQGNSEALAVATLNLLDSPLEAYEVSRQGLAHAAEIASADVAAQWHSFLNDVFSAHSIKADAYEVLMFSQIAAFESCGKQELKDKIASIEASRAAENARSLEERRELRRRIIDLEYDIEHLKTSNSYKIGRAMTKPVRRIKGDKS